MSKTKGNPVARWSQFEEQLEEVGVQNLQTVEMGKGSDGEVESIVIRLANSIDAPDAAEFAERIQSCETSEDVALVVLDYHPDGVSAEDQWATFQRFGGTADKLAAFWTAASADQQERLGKLRPRRRR